LILSDEKIASVLATSRAAVKRMTHGSLEEFGYPGASTHSQGVNHVFYEDGFPSNRARCGLMAAFQLSVCLVEMIPLTPISRAHRHSSTLFARNRDAGARNLTRRLGRSCAIVFLERALESKLIGRMSPPSNAGRHDSQVIVPFFCCPFWHPNG
jgi:hypothetical protein